jgi:hypothetical protein
MNREVQVRNPYPGAARGREGGPSRPKVGEIIRELPIDYQIIEPIIRRRGKIIVEMEDFLLEETLTTTVINPRTGEETEFGYLYQWGIDVVPHCETVYDSDGIERLERLTIDAKDLRKLEGYVLRFFLEGNSLGEYYLDEAAYLVRDGELVPAPEYLANNSVRSQVRE